MLFSRRTTRIMLILSIQHFESVKNVIQQFDTL